VTYSWRPIDSRTRSTICYHREAFYEWGAESGLYFTSGRRPLSGIIFAYPMLAGPLAGKLSRRLLDDLERSRPDLIVVNDQTFAFAQTQGQHPVLSWLKRKLPAVFRRQHVLVACPKRQQAGWAEAAPGKGNGEIHCPSPEAFEISACAARNSGSCGLSWRAVSISARAASVLPRFNCALARR
jgi:hypothetical protein